MSMLACHHLADTGQEEEVWLADTQTKEAVDNGDAA